MRKDDLFFLQLSVKVSSPHSVGPFFTFANYWTSQYLQTRCTL